MHILSKRSIPFQFLILMFSFGILLLTTNARASEGGKNHLGFFSGTTVAFSQHHSNFTLGLDYEYQVSQIVGLGAIGEFVFAEHFETLTMCGLIVHAVPDFKIIVANGLVFANSETAYIFRVGTAYDFQVDILTVSPTFNLDFIHSHTYGVFGIALGFGF